MSNKYHDTLTTKHPDPTVFNLLELLRPEVEAVLQELVPHMKAPSQSIRIEPAMAVLRRRIRDIREDAKAPGGLRKFECLRPLNRQMELLDNFRCVHRACWILEGRAL